MNIENEIADAKAEGEKPFQELAEIAPNTSVSPAHGIAAIALNMAMKYHDMSILKDGTMYQQYKMEGRNIREIGLDDVFETAIKIEMHLLGSSDRIAKMVVEAITLKIEDEDQTEDPIENTQSDIP